MSPCLITSWFGATGDVQAELRNKWSVRHPVESKRILPGNGDNRPLKKQSIQPTCGKQLQTDLCSFFFFKSVFLLSLTSLPRAKGLAGCFFLCFFFCHIHLPSLPAYIFMINILLLLILKNNFNRMMYITDCFLTYCSATAAKEDHLDKPDVNSPIDHV